MLYIQDFKIERTKITSYIKGPEAARGAFFRQAGAEFGEKVTENIPFELTESTPDTESYERRLLVTTEKNWIDFKSELSEIIWESQPMQFKIDKLRELIVEFEKK